MAILFVAIDLAKSVIAVHGINDAGKPELVRPNVPRNKLLELFAELPPCTIVMEACSGRASLGTVVQALGHTVRLIARVSSPAPRTGCRASGARTTRPTPKPSAKPCSGPTCAACQSRAPSSRGN